MGKTIYTERDIEDLAQQGKRSLEITEEILLTELAVEKARQLGITLENRQEAPPSAPVRPYLVSKPLGKPGARQPAAAPSANGSTPPASAIPGPAAGAVQPPVGASLPQSAPPATAVPKKFPEPVLAPLPPTAKPDLRQRISSAVSARLGSELDPALLDRIIGRILDNIPTK